ncbi:MAG: thiamine pyrophosphate-dependent enzyme [Thermodesulfobacteriota bacterium]
MMGNEAIARGALEVGVMVATAYPGTPSSEVIGSLADVAKERKIYVEWSVNEKLALEIAAAASMTGLRAIVAMKQNGINVASDYLFTLGLTGTKGGLVLVVCDDPGSHSSSNEEDTRLFARMGDFPLLEPATFQEAKDMTQYALELSEELKSIVILRSVTRISHARGNVKLGHLAEVKGQARFDVDSPFSYAPMVQKHASAHEKLKKAQESFERCHFNGYEGPEKPDLMIFASGTGIFYSREAVALTGVEARVGILKIGTSWPLPERLIRDYISRSSKILFIEEVDPFLEFNVKEIWADLAVTSGLSPRVFFGKRSGHIPREGELNTDRVIEGLRKALDVQYEPRDPIYAARTNKLTKDVVSERDLGFCPGCPHRASYWAIKNALRLDDREGFLVPDIGCYTLARTASGFFLSKTGGAMGSGTGLACGFGKLDQFGFDQPVISVCGDSTFFHAAMPALANAQYSKSNLLMCILDNSATAMTGFQPHPGVGRNALGDPAPVLDIEMICRSMGVKVVVKNPFDLKDTIDTITHLLQDDEGVKVLILKQKCALLRAKDEKPPYRMHIDHGKCVGQECGCNRLCTRIFRCPGIIWDSEVRKAKVDEVICVGCGVCADICPNSAIIKEEAS